MPPNPSAESELFRASVAAAVQETMFAVFGPPESWPARRGGASVDRADRIDAAAVRTVGEWIEDYIAMLIARNAGKAHTQDIRAKLAKAAAWGNWSTPADITEDAVVGFKAYLKTEGNSRGAGGRAGLGAQTVNHYMAALRQFCGWLLKKGLVALNPAAEIATETVDLDRRHERRSLLPDEFERLIAAAHNGPTLLGISGPDRALMYCVAAWTGFRKRAIGSLTPAAFQFGSHPTVTIAAAFDKAKKRRVLPLHPDLADVLQPWLTAKMADAARAGVADPGKVILWAITGDSGGVERNTARMMERDLATAGLPYRDAAGRYADFHGNRRTFATSLRRAGIDPRLSQELVGHASIDMTMHYTDVVPEEQAAAILALPPPPVAVLRRTGTGGVAPAPKRLKLFVPDEEKKP